MVRVSAPCAFYLPPCGGADSGAGRGSRPGTPRPGCARALRSRCAGICLRGRGGRLGGAAGRARRRRWSGSHAPRASAVADHARGAEHGLGPGEPRKAVIRVRPIRPIRPAVDAGAAHRRGGKPRRVIGARAKPGGLGAVRLAHGSHDGPVCHWLQQSFGAKEEGAVVAQIPRVTPAALRLQDAAPVANEGPARRSARPLARAQRRPLAAAYAEHRHAHDAAHSSPRAFSAVAVAA